MSGLAGGHNTWGSDFLVTYFQGQFILHQERRLKLRQCSNAALEELANALLSGV